MGRRLLPSTPWRYCRSTRPKTCTRVVTTWRFYMRTARFQTWQSVWRQAFSANEFLKSGVRHFHVQQGPTGLLHMSKCHLTPSGRSQFRWSSDMTSPFPPSGNEGYIRNRDVLLQIYILEHVFSWFIVEL